MSGLPEDRNSKTTIDIGVCTYRRRELELALRSLGGLEVPPDVTVNEASPSVRSTGWLKRA